jgi:hypothetical protein
MRQKALISADKKTPSAKRHWEYEGQTGQSIVTVWCAIPGDGKKLAVQSAIEEYITKNSRCCKQNSRDNKLA